MGTTDYRILERLKQIIDAWRTLAPAAILNGQTLEQFETATKTPGEVRQRIREAELTLVGLRQERLRADYQLRDQLAELVDAVKGNPEFGANSPLYSAFGYVPRDARKSGLTRKGSATNPSTESASAA